VLAGSILPYDTATPQQNRAMQVVNHWIRDEAQRDPMLDFVDTRHAVAADADPDRLISSPDSLHPSVDAYRLLADAIRSSLEKIIR
jgi:hypothetical protein